MAAIYRLQETLVDMVSYIDQGMPVRRQTVHRAQAEIRRAIEHHVTQHAEIKRLREEIKLLTSAAQDDLADVVIDKVLDGEAQQAKIERLQAIVDRLPKCWRLNDAGELVQDVPVVPGMIVWRVWSASEYLPCSISKLHYPAPVGPSAIMDSNLNNHPAADCYSTIEAAEAALRKSNKEGDVGY